MRVGRWKKSDCRGRWFRSRRARRHRRTRAPDLGLRPPTGPTSATRSPRPTSPLRGERHHPAQRQRRPGQAERGRGRRPLHLQGRRRSRQLRTL